MASAPAHRHACVESPPALVAIDWGSSNLRVALLNAQGQVLAQRHSTAGALTLAVPQFEPALRALCGEWLDSFPDLTLMSCGMVGSRQGWKEAPYLECPASLDQAARHLTAVSLLSGRTVYVVPGLHTLGADGQHDLMRGEETQLWGADLPPQVCCVLPGTHSKWAWLSKIGCIDTFETHMTGELYAVLSQHSMLGRLMEYGAFDRPAFEQGVRLGLQQQSNATHALFTVRSAGLMGEVAPSGLPDYLSGLLIGIEIASASALRSFSEIVLLGANALANRYASALALANIPARQASPDVAMKGLWRIAVSAGLAQDSENS